MNKLKAKSNAINLQGANYRLSLVFLAAISVLGILYIYFIFNSIYLVVERKNLEEKKSYVSGEITELATAYIDRQEAITKDYAQTLGFVDSTDTSLYATRQTDSLTLTLLGENDSQ